MATNTQASEPETALPAMRASALGELAPRPFTVKEYSRLLEAGILDDDERSFELLEGVIVTMSRQNPPHASVIRRLTMWLAAQLSKAHMLQVQLPLTLGEHSQPVPDLSVVHHDETSKTSHPKTALLVIEVADSSLLKDRGFKLALYARYGIPEYWIVDVQNATIEVYRDPDPEAGRYRSLLTFGLDATLSPTSVPGVSVSLAELFA